MKTEIRIIAEMTDEQCEVLLSELINTSEIIGIKLEVESSKLSQHDVIKNEVVVCGLYDDKIDCAEYKFENGKSCLRCKWRKQTDL